MKLFQQLTFAILLFAAHSCSTQEQKQSSETKVVAAAQEEDQFPDIQTLTENHKILTIRVAGDLNKVSADTKSKIETLSKSFNASLEQYKTAIDQHSDLLQKMKTLEATDGIGGKKTPAMEEAAAKLQTATQAAEQAQSEYNEVARQFSQLIETVKSERSKQ